MTSEIEIPIEADSEGDMLAILVALTNLVKNERVRAFNQGFDAGHAAASDKTSVIATKDR